MHLSFITYLKCPVTGEPLRLSKIDEQRGDFVVSGELSSMAACYPIIRGIPRFVKSEAYTSSFGIQWNPWV